MNRHGVIYRFALTGIILWLTGLCISCKPKIPQGVMSEGKLEDVLYDYSLALSMAENENASGADREAMRYQYVQKVFDKYGITEAYFDSSMVWYAAEGKRLAAIFQRIGDRLDAEAKTLGVDLSETELYASYTIDGDTANVWNGSRIVYLSKYMPDNVKIISILSDSTFLPGDKYKLSFNAHFLPSSGRSHQTYVLFSAYYADSSVVSQTQLVGGDYRVELNLTPKPSQDTLRLDRLVVTLYQPSYSAVSSTGSSVSEDGGNELFYLTYPAVLRIHKEKTEEKSTTISTDDGVALPVDTLSSDTLASEPSVVDERRLSPLEERDLREERHDIEIVKERIIRPASRPVVRKRSF